MSKPNAEMTDSDRIIAGMMAANPNIKNRGFRKAINEIPELCGFLDGCHILPDGFHISTAKREITILEVDDTHPITPEKCGKIAEFSNRCDGEEWTVIIHMMDYLGNVTDSFYGDSFVLGAVYIDDEKYKKDALPYIRKARNAVAKLQKDVMHQ